MERDSGDELDAKQHATTSPMAVGPSNTPQPNKNIMDLPPELLREIFISIDGQFSKTLWGLSLTCQLFRNVVEEYCEPEYNMRGNKIGDPYALLEQLRDRPHFRELIRVLRVDHDCIRRPELTFEYLESLHTSLGIDGARPTSVAEWPGIKTGEHVGPLWLAASLPNVEILESTDSGVHTPLMRLL